MEWTKLLCSERMSGDKFSENKDLNLSPFERDYYTIISNSYFRRLQRKTQVYVLDESDFSRTRLTHSMEVSSIAEILGKRVGKKIINMYSESENLPENFEEDLSCVLRCSGLLHDLGNPPFGHSGEEYIRAFFQENELKLRKNLDEQMWLDFINFEGNAHNIRIVTKLGESSNPEDKKHGMDLTRAVVNSLIKYPYNSLDYNNRTPDKNGNKKRGKIGYYHADEWLIKKLVAPSTGTGNETDERLLKDPIMLLMEAADDIAYATADIEDAYKKHYLRGNDILKVLRKNPPSDESELENYEKHIENNGIFKKTEEEQIKTALKYVREQAMLHVIDEFMNNYDSIMNGSYNGELIDGCQFNISELKTLLYEIFDQRDKSIEKNYKKRIFDILDYLINAVDALTKNELSFSEKIIIDKLNQYIVKGEKEAELAANHGGNAEMEILYHHYMAIVDFVSGMTDSYVNIFWNEIYSDDNLSGQKRVYKENCLKKLLSISENDETNDLSKIIANMQYVDCWENYEILTILKWYMQYGINYNEISSSMNRLFARIDRDDTLPLTKEETDFWNKVTATLE